MFTLVNQPGDRVFTISLRRGEMLLEGVQKAIEENGIGAVMHRHAVFHDLAQGDYPGCQTP